MKYRIAKLLCICLVLMNCNLTFGRELVLSDADIIKQIDLFEEECPILLSVVDLDKNYITVKIDRGKINDQLKISVLIKDIKGKSIEYKELINSVVDEDNYINKLEIDNEYYLEFNIERNDKITERYRGKFSTKDSYIGDNLKVSNINKCIVLNKKKLSEFECNIMLKNIRSKFTTPSMYEVGELNEEIENCEIGGIRVTDIHIKDVDVKDDMSWFEWNDETYVETVTMDIYVENRGPDKLLDGYAVLVETDVEYIYAPYRCQLVPDRSDVIEVMIDSVHIETSEVKISVELLEGYDYDPKMSNNVWYQVLNLSNYVSFEITHRGNYGIEKEMKDGKEYIKEMLVDLNIKQKGIATISKGMIVSAKQYINGKLEEVQVADYKYNIPSKVGSEQNMVVKLQGINPDADNITIYLEPIDNVNVDGNKCSFSIKETIIPDLEQFDMDNRIQYEKLANGKYIYFKYDLNGNLLKKWIE